MHQVQVQAKPGELSVCIGFPTGAYIPWQTALSLAATTRLCAQQGISIDVAVIAGAAIVTDARSQVADVFLKGKQSRLFWIDSDITWRAEDFIRMLVMTAEMDVVCAAYPRKRPDLGLTIQHSYPTINAFETNRFGCVKIDGTGLGFTVMTRAVIEKLAARAPRIFDEAYGAEIAEVFRTDTVSTPGRPKTRRGEDIAFFSDVRAAGYSIWLDPTVKLGHVGSHVHQTDVLKALGLVAQ